MREDYERFREKETEILAVFPTFAEKLSTYFVEHRIPFPGLADTDHSVFNSYSASLWAFGHHAGLFIIDKRGFVRYAYRGNRLLQIPDNASVLGALSELQGTVHNTIPHQRGGAQK